MTHARDLRRQALQQRIVYGWYANATHVHAPGLFDPHFAGAVHEDFADVGAFQPGAEGLEVTAQVDVVRDRGGYCGDGGGRCRSGAHREAGSFEGRRSGRLTVVELGSELGSELMANPEKSRSRAANT